MANETGTQLAEYAAEQVGDALRTVIVLYEDDIELIYLSDDLCDIYSRGTFTHVAESFRDNIDEHFDVTRGSPLGDNHCLIHHYEDAFVFQFPHDDCHSILLSVDPEVGSQLDSFVTECEQYL